MAYTDPSTLTFATNENPLASAKLNSATNDQFLALFPDGVAGVDWNPTLEATSSNPTSSAVTGRRYRIGAMEFFWVEFSISAAGSGVYFVTLPRASVGLDASANEGSGQTVGSWTFRDNSGPNSRGGTVLMRATDEVHFNVGPGLLQSTFPFTVASGDQLNMEFKIPIA